MVNFKSDLWIESWKRKGYFFFGKTKKHADEQLKVSYTFFKYITMIKIKPIIKEKNCIYLILESSVIILEWQ